MNAADQGGGSRLLAAILLASVVLRLVFSLGISRGLMHARPELQVTDGYNQIAENLVQGHGYRQFLSHPPTTERPPGYPVFLYLIFRVFGIDYVAVQVFQALLGALGAGLLYLLGRWAHSRGAGLCAAGLFAVYPSALEYSARLYSENLFFPLYFALAYFLCRAAREQSSRQGFAAGVVWGLGILTRGTLLALPIVLPFALLLRGELRLSLRRWPRWCLPALLGAVLVCAPWTARNYRLTGSFIPVSTWGWAPFYHGIQSAKRMLAWEDLERADREATRERHRIVVQRLYGGDSTRAYASPREYVRHEQVARSLVLQELRRDPAGAALRTLVGIPFAWFQTLGPKKRLLSLLLHLPLMFLFLLGLLRMHRRDPEAFGRAYPALVLILFVNLFQALVWPHARYMAPAVGLSFVYSAVPVLGILAWLRGMRADSAIRVPHE